MITISNGYRQAINKLEDIGEIKFIKGDLRNPAEIDHVFETEKIDAVMHFAALCSVDESMKHPDCILRTIRSVHTIY